MPRIRRTVTSHAANAAPRTPTAIVSGLIVALRDDGGDCACLDVAAIRSFVVEIESLAGL
jgi:hypothetical protein